MKIVDLKLQNPADYAWVRKELELAGFTLAQEAGGDGSCSFRTDDASSDEEITECIQDILTRRNSSPETGIVPVVGDIVSIR